MGDASEDDVGGINEGPDDVVDGKAAGIFDVVAVGDDVDVDVDVDDEVEVDEGEVDGSAGDGSEGVGFSDGVVDGRLLGTVAGGLGNDGCAVTIGAGLVGLAGWGNALGELTICAGILLEPGSGFEGTEGTDTLVESPCILDDNSSDGTFGVEVAGAEGNDDGELGCGVALGRTGGWLAGAGCGTAGCDNLGAGGVGSDGSVVGVVCVG